MGYYSDFLVSRASILFLFYMLFDFFAMRSRHLELNRCFSFLIRISGLTLVDWAFVYNCSYSILPVRGLANSALDSSYEKLCCVNGYQKRVPA